MNNSITNKYKDADPIDTVEKIRKIFYNMGIILYEKNWTQIGNSCYSVRIEIDGLPETGMNGKSTSRIFALASAYGELIERLQNGNLLKRNFGLKQERFTFNDEVQVELKDILNKKYISNLINDFNQNYEIIQNIINEYDSLKLCLPYNNYFKNKIELIPSRLLAFTCGTNGMCAGNTKEEALIHGICEVFERYLSKQIIFSELELPEIPFEKVSMQELSEVVTLLKNSSYDIKVKDCTLGGRYPVVGLLIVNKNKTKFFFKLGSDPVLHIAVERCFTELFQGINIHELDSRMNDIKWNSTRTLKEKIKILEHICKNGNGAYPNSVLFNNKISNVYERAFLSNYTNNEIGLQHIYSIIKKEKLELFIRDVSYLGFPSYRIYIPGITEIYLMDTESIKDKFKRATVAKYLLNVYKCSKEQLKEVLNYLEAYILENWKINIGNTNIFREISLDVKENSEFKNIKVAFLACLISISLEEFPKAHYYLSKYIETIKKESYSNINYYMGAYTYLSYKTNGMYDDEIIKKMQDLYGESLTNEIVEDLTVENIFKHIQLPSCPDCNICKISQECHFDKWSKLNNQLIKSINNENTSKTSRLNKSARQFTNSF